MIAIVFIAILATAQAVFPIDDPTAGKIGITASDPQQPSDNRFFGAQSRSGLTPGKPQFYTAGDLSGRPENKAALFFPLKDGAGGNVPNSLILDIPFGDVPPETRPEVQFVAPSAHVPGHPSLAISPHPIKLHNQNPDGSYDFVYAGGPSSRAEVRDPSGAVRGSFKYVDAFGRIQTQTYVADDSGFRTVGSDIPKPEFTVPETPEVQFARKNFEATFKKAQTGIQSYPGEVYTPTYSADQQGSVRQPVYGYP